MAFSPEESTKSFKDKREEEYRVLQDEILVLYEDVLKEIPREDDFFYGTEKTASSIIFILYSMIFVVGTTDLITINDRHAYDFYAHTRKDLKVVMGKINHVYDKDALMILAEFSSKIIDKVRILNLE